MKRGCLELSATTLPRGYEMQHIARGSRGGGCTIIHRSYITIKPTTANGKFVSFEHQECMVMAAHPIKLSLVYRQPNNSNRCPMSQFFDEFASLLESHCLHTGQILVLGDMNFHMDDPTDRDALKLTALLESLNLWQHVTKSTHRSGHILDLVIIGIMSEQQYIIRFNVRGAARRRVY